MIFKERRFLTSFYLYVIGIWYMFRLAIWKRKQKKRQNITKRQKKNKTGRKIQPNRIKYNWIEWILSVFLSLCNQNRIKLNWKSHLVERMENEAEGTSSGCVTYGMWFVGFILWLVSFDQIMEIGGWAPNGMLQTRNKAQQHQVHTSRTSNHNVWRVHFQDYSRSYFLLAPKRLYRTKIPNQITPFYSSFSVVTYTRKRNVISLPTQYALFSYNVHV